MPYLDQTQPEILRPVSNLFIVMSIDRKSVV